MGEKAAIANYLNHINNFLMLLIIKSFGRDEMTK